MARPSRNAWSSTGPKLAFACFASAAAPATWGADAEVPEKPEIAQPKKLPYVAVETASGPTMSGFTRPSIVGPSELYSSSAEFCQQIAPTAIALGDDAGSTMLPDATRYCRVPLFTKRSKRGAALADALRMAM